jgi:hypothetical protein
LEDVTISSHLSDDPVRVEDVPLTPFDDRVTYAELMA